MNLQTPVFLAATLSGLLLQACAAPEVKSSAGPEAPDLVVELASPMTGNFRIRNIGKTAAPASTAVIGCRRTQIVESLDARPECPPFRAWHDRDVAGYWYSKLIPVGPLAPGESQTLAVPDWKDITLETDASFRFHVEADIDNLVPESNENNNVAESSRVQP